MLKWYILLLFNVMLINSESYNTTILISNDYFYSGYGSGSISGSGSNDIIQHNEPNKETNLRSKVIYSVSILLFSISIFCILYGLYTPQQNETIEIHSFSNPLFNLDDLDDDNDEPLYQPNIGIPKYAMYNDNFDYDYDLSDTEI
jgi:hypothetical protein